MDNTLPIYIVDAFSGKPYSGNPAGICLTFDQVLDEQTQLKIAAEMNHSETAFVTTTSCSNDSQEPLYGLRWFTPKNEVNLCGHATLATAHVLFNVSKTVQGNVVRFETKSGILKVSRLADGSLQMDFPRGNPVPLDLGSSVSHNLADAFGIPASHITFTSFCQTTKKLIVELRSPADVWAAAVPSAEALTTINWPAEVRGVALTASKLNVEGWKQVTEQQAQKLEGCDFMTRYFSPWNGIAEDPVNGSSHTALPYFYATRFGKNKMVSFAASAREGTLSVEIVPDIPERIFISGVASLVLEGKIHLK